MRLLSIQALMGLAVVPFTVTSPIDSPSVMELPAHMNWTVIPGGPPFDPAEHAAELCQICPIHSQGPRPIPIPKPAPVPHVRCCTLEPPPGEGTGVEARAPKAAVAGRAMGKRQEPEPQPTNGGCLRGSWCFGCNNPNDCFWCIWPQDGQNQQAGCYPAPG